MKVKVLLRDAMLSLIVREKEPSTMMAEKLFKVIDLFDEFYPYEEWEKEKKMCFIEWE